MGQKGSQSIALDWDDYYRRMEAARVYTSLSLNGRTRFEDEPMYHSYYEQKPASLKHGLAEKYHVPFKIDGPLRV
jgi:hypothetical protein